MSRFVALAFIFGLVNVFPVQNVFAQNVAYNKVTIEIGATNDGSCWYEVFDKDGSALQDQDDFTVKPNARITLNAQTSARVTFASQLETSEDGVATTTPAVDLGDLKIHSLDAGQDAVEVKVRKSKSVNGAKANSTHRVWIFCTSTDAEGTTVLDGADTKTASTGFNEQGIQPDLLGESGRGPAAPQEWIPAVRVYKGKVISQGGGGPGMVVEDP